jgi:hypothetical protein
LFSDNAIDCLPGGFIIGWWRDADSDVVAHGFGSPSLFQRAADRTFREYTMRDQQFPMINGFCRKYSGRSGERGCCLHV